MMGTMGLVHQMRRLLVAVGGEVIPGWMGVMQTLMMRLLRLLPGEALQL